MSGAKIELRAPGDNEWYQDLVAEIEFTDTDDHEWASIQPVLRLSLEGYAGDYYWAPHILTMDTIQYRIGEITGGHAALSFGNISFSPDLFVGNLWPPQTAFSFVLYHGDNKITDGILHLSAITDESIEYEVYGNEYDVNILETAIHYRSDGDYTEAEAQPLPLALGEIVHRNPVRLPDADGGNLVYSKCGLSGSNGTDWHVYDDGVNIDSNVANETASQFELTAVPVGEVTVSGTGSLTTLADVVGYACTKIGVSLNSDDARSPSPTLSWFLTNQRTVISFLDDICSMQTHLFYIGSSTLYLIDCMGFTSTASIENANKIIDSKYRNNPAMASFEATWDERSPVGTERIKTEDRNYIRFTRQSYGDKREVSVYQTNDLRVATTLGNMISIYQRKQAEITLPIDGDLPTVGMQYNIEDTTMHASLSVEMYIRGVNYDLAQDKMTLIGDCILS